MAMFTTGTPHKGSEMDKNGLILQRVYLRKKKKSEMKTANMRTGYYSIFSISSHEIS